LAMFNVPLLVSVPVTLLVVLNSIMPVFAFVRLPVNDRTLSAAALSVASASTTKLLLLVKADAPRLMLMVFAPPVVLVKCTPAYVLVLEKLKETVGTVPEGLI